MNLSILEEIEILRDFPTICGKIKKKGKIDL